MWWKKHKWKILIPALVLALLAGAYCLGGSAPEQPAAAAPSTSAAAQPETQENPEPGAAQQPQNAAQEPQPGSAAQVPAAQQEPTEAAPEQAAEPDAPAQPEPAAPAPAEPAQTQPAQAQPSQTQPAQTQPSQTRPAQQPQQDDTEPVLHCTLSISCATILSNLGRCDPDKIELVPEDGWILPPTSVIFYEGESVFNVLQRTCRQQGIHMEYENTPMYNSAYIEGIGNLYEFDVGEQSGWMYAVNGWYPNYGCSRYTLRDGDTVTWVYTCDLGSDVGGGYAAGDAQ